MSWFFVYVRRLCVAYFILCISNHYADTLYCVYLPLPVHSLLTCTHQKVTYTTYCVLTSTQFAVYLYGTFTRTRIYCVFQALVQRQPFAHRFIPTRRIPYLDGGWCAGSRTLLWQWFVLTAPSLHFPCTILAPSLHHPYTFLTPSLHHPHTFLAPSLHLPCTFLTPSSHHPYTFLVFAPSLHLPCTFLTPSLHLPCTFLAIHHRSHPDVLKTICPPSGANWEQGMIDIYGSAYSGGFKDMSKAVA